MGLLKMGKTKVLVVSKENVPRVRTEVIRRKIEVSKFSYLGSWITAACRCEKEIRIKIGIAKSAFMRMKVYLTNRKLSIGIRKRAAKKFIWSTMLYGCEIWMMNKKMQEMLEAAEMLQWMRILNIS